MRVRDLHNDRHANNPPPYAKIESTQSLGAKMILEGQTLNEASILPFNWQSKMDLFPRMIEKSKVRIFLTKIPIIYK